MCVFKRMCVCIGPFIHLLFISFLNDATHYYDVIYMSHASMRLTLIQIVYVLLSLSFAPSRNLYVFVTLFRIFSMLMQLLC